MDSSKKNEDSGDEISIHFESLSSSGLTQPETDDQDARETPTRPSRVRFRSRVRIGSSHHRSHRRLSATSSLSGSVSDSSRSSSISAPLRSTPTAENCSPGWGTLGTRVALLAYANRPKQAQGGQDQSPGRQRKARPSETSPLLAPPAYEDGWCSNSDDEEEEEAEAVRLARQVDAVFGPWPGRLLNRYWWLWQLEPILCCSTCCLDDSEYD